MTAPAPRAPAPAFDVERFRAAFPGLDQAVHDKPLAFLDSAASTQTARPVIDAITHAYTFDRANIHRGVHTLSQRATQRYEAARDAMAALLGAAQREEILMLRGTTEGINLVAQTLGRAQVGPGDEVLITALEHHSNIVPWQMLCQERGATLKVAPMNARGEVPLDSFTGLLSDKTRIAAFAHVSNALGTINPVREMIAAAKAHGAVTVVDGAQAIAHLKVDVQALGCDFYAVSGHKMFGPTGVGVLYGRRALLDAMPPWQGGGDMILQVRFDGTSYAEVPHKFEAGTPNIVGGIGLGEAARFLSAIELEAAAAHEDALLAHATEEIQKLPGARVVGTAPRKAGVLSFVLDDIHPHDVGTVLDFEGVAVRTGHHCAQPVMDFFGIPATTRASFAFYNTHDDVERLLTGLRRVIEVLR